MSRNLVPPLYIHFFNGIQQIFIRFVLHCVVISGKGHVIDQDVELVRIGVEDLTMKVLNVRDR